MLWTGGKDSALALYEAQQAGHVVDQLITFVPKKQKFLAHPVSFMKHQSEAIGIPHRTVEIKEPFRESYKKALASLGTAITGDIAEVDGYPNWIRECSSNVITPLWGIDRMKLLDKLREFKVVFSCVKRPWFTEDWLGRELGESISDLSKLNIDIAGENGEYHTLVLDGPMFKKSIRILDCKKCANGSLMHLDIKKVVLKKKQFYSPPRDYNSCP